MNQTKVIIFGGNGFVGTHIAKNLVDLDAAPVCISRTGTRLYTYKIKLGVNKLNGVKATPANQK